MSTSPEELDTSTTTETNHDVHIIRRLDPWSVAKSSFMLGIVIAGVLIIATTVIWLILSAAGVFDSVTSVFSKDADSTSSGINMVSFARLIGVSMLIGAVEIVLLTVFSAVFAQLYNLSVGFTGGIKVTVGKEI